MIQEELPKTQMELPNGGSTSDSCGESSNVDGASESVEKAQESHNMPVTISSTKDEIVARINATEDMDELKGLANLFGISMTKKEIARASVQSDLMDLLLEAAGSRIRENGDYMSNDELMEFYKMFQSNIDRSRKSLGAEMDEASTAYTNNTQVNITVNNNGPEVSRESRERIIDVVNMLLHAGVTDPTSGQAPNETPDIIDMTSSGDGGNPNE